MKKKKETFVVTIDDKEVTLAVIRPGNQQYTEAQKVGHKSFRDAIEGGAFIRQELEGVLRSRNLWNDEKQREMDTLIKRIGENEMKLKGGIKLSEARQLAIQIRMDRARQLDLLSERSRLDIHTAEAQAEAARFNRLVSLCTIYNDNGKAFFNGYEDYLERASEPAAMQAAQTLAYMEHNLDPNYQSNLPENKFLLKWKMVDEKLRLVNKHGHLVDVDGRLINEDGFYVDENNNPVDRDGNKLDTRGNLFVEESPFLDEDGNPLLEPEEEVELQKAEDTHEPPPAKKKK